MKTIVLLSGGMDSAVLAYKLREQGHEIKAISFAYGQKHHKELLCAQAIAAELKCEHRIADITSLQDIFAGSALIDNQQEIPLGHYAAESMKVTIVPNRNMIFMSIATAWAIASDYQAIAIAAHAGDHYIYPDCRAEFTEALAKAVALADEKKVVLKSPFIELTKAEICTLGFELKTPFEKTWSCYKGADLHCGKCGTCWERKEAFNLAGIYDPTEYLP